MQRERRGASMRLHPNRTDRCLALAAQPLKPWELTALRCPQTDSPPAVAVVADLRP
jgi:hypothetical protein